MPDIQILKFIIRKRRLISTVVTYLDSNTSPASYLAAGLENIIVRVGQSE